VTLPVIAVPLPLHMGKGDRGAGGEPPFELLLSGRAVEARVYLLALIPEAALGRTCVVVRRKMTAPNPGRATTGAGRGGGRRLTAPGSSAVDGDVGIGAEEVSLRPGLRPEPSRSQRLGA